MFAGGIVVQTSCLTKPQKHLTCLTCLTCLTLGLLGVCMCSVYLTALV